MRKKSTKLQKIYQQLLAANIDVLFDDRKERAGVIFADMDLIGIPHRIIISESGLNGFNLTKKTLTAYWVDPKEKSNDDFLRFKDQITRVVELVGNATGRPKPAIERLTIYGKGQRELSSIRGDILTAQASDTVTPKLIAQFINKQPVTTFKQKDLTKSQI